MKRVLVQGDGISDVTQQMVQLLGYEMWKCGILQKEVADRLGVSQKHISLVLNGKAQASNDLLEDWAAEIGKRFRICWETSP